MDQTAEPDPASFIFLVDDVEKVPTLFTWVDATNCDIEFNEAVLGPTVVRSRYSLKNPLFLSVGGELVTPFHILVTAP